MVDALWQHANGCPMSSTETNVSVQSFDCFNILFAWSCSTTTHGKKNYTRKLSPFTYILRKPTVTGVVTIVKTHCSSGRLYPRQRTVSEMTGGMLALPASLLQLPNVNTFEPRWHHPHHGDESETICDKNPSPCHKRTHGELQRCKHWCGRCHLISTTCYMHHPPPLGEEENDDNGVWRCGA